MFRHGYWGTEGRRERSGGPLSALAEVASSSPTQPVFQIRSAVAGGTPPNIPPEHAPEVCPDNQFPRSAKMHDTFVYTPRSPRRNFPRVSESCRTIQFVINEGQKLSCCVLLSKLINIGWEAIGSALLRMQSGSSLPCNFAKLSYNMFSECAVMYAQKDLHDCGQCDAVFVCWARFHSFISPSFNWRASF